MKCVGCGSDQLAEAFDGKTWNVKGINKTLSYKQCCVCRSLSLFPGLSDVELEKYYAQSYDYATFKTMQKGKQAEARIRINRMNDLHNGSCPKDVLDVGANCGHFLHVAQESDWTVKGIELSAEALNYAKETYGLSLKHGGVDLLYADTFQYDALTMWHVLEHIQQPAKVIKGVANHLKTGGIFACAIPNIESLSARVCGASWRWLSPPAHVHHLTKKALCDICKENGLKLVHSYTVDNFASNDMIYEYITSVFAHDNTVLPDFIADEIKKIIDEETLGDALMFPNAWKCEKGTYLESSAIDGIKERPHKRLRSYTRYLSTILYPFLKELWDIGLGAELECYFVKE